MSRIRAAGFVLLLLHSLAVGWVTLRPRAVPWVRPSNLRPFETIRADLAEGPAAALESIGGGLLLLAPLGVLLPIVFGRLHKPLLGTAAYTILSGVLVTLAFGILEAGVPGRTVNVDTLILHAAGVALAQLLVYPMVRRRLLRRLRRSARSTRDGAGGTRLRSESTPPDRAAGGSAAHGPVTERRGWAPAEARLRPCTAGRPDPSHGTAAAPRASGVGIAR